MKRIDENIPQVNNRIRLFTPWLEDNRNKTSTKKNIRNGCV